MTASNIPSLDEILEDLTLRFIVTSPEEEYESLDRLLFQFESAHWFYLDEHYDRYPDRLPKLSFKEFCATMFDTYCPHLRHHATRIQQHIRSFQKYKNSVPVCGCIILNKNLTKVVMVKAWAAKSTWNFPRGKINKNESEIDCAIRETREEIGYAVASNDINDRQFIEITTQGKMVKLYIVDNVSEDTKFETQTRKEISNIKWHTLSQMSPDDRRYHSVWPFIREIKQWVRRNKHLTGQRSPLNQSSSHVNIQNSIKTPTQQQYLQKSPTEANYSKDTDRSISKKSRHRKRNRHQRISGSPTSVEGRKSRNSHSNKNTTSSGYTTSRLQPVSLFDFSPQNFNSNNNKGFVNFSFNASEILQSCQARA